MCILSNVPQLGVREIERERNIARTAHRAREKRRLYLTHSNGIIKIPLIPTKKFSFQNQWEDLAERAARHHVSAAAQVRLRRSPAERAQ
jgi:ABC-type transport system involved in cytochrome c biogenesis ATPase subunit